LTRGLVANAACLCASNPLRRYSSAVIEATPSGGKQSRSFNGNVRHLFPGEIDGGADPLDPGD
jgi:hypothetical protein